MKNTWRFAGNELQYVQEVIDSGFGSGTSGNMNNRFEVAFAEKVGANYAVTFNSGTSTLHAALHAIGVRAGDEVIVPPLTVISNVDVIFAMNAIPVFCDIDATTFNLNPAYLESLITDRTRCIMPVSLYGLSCDLDPIMTLAEKYNIPVVNDAAEAHGATYKEKPLAAIAHITSYSLENSKHITTGDGGIVVTNDSELASKMRKFGSLGYQSLTSKDGRIRLNKDLFQNPAYKRHDDLGLNYRMPEVAAALGLAQTERLEFFVDLRIQIANLYGQAIEGCEYLLPQRTIQGCKNTFWTYAVTYERDDVPWDSFRRKFIEFGGDGIYAAWALSYEETVISSGAFRDHCPPIYDQLSYLQGICPVAEEVQPKLMQFVTNYGSITEGQQKAEALEKTIAYFR